MIVLEKDNSMDCKTVKEQLSQLIDSEISETEALEIMKHLKTCSECKRVYDDLLTLRNSLINSRREDAPPYFMVNVKEALKKEKKRGLLLRFPVNGKGLSVVAALFIIGFMGIYYMQDLNIQHEPEAVNGNLRVFMEQEEQRKEIATDMDSEVVYYIDKLKEMVNKDFEVLKTKIEEDGTIVLEVSVDGVVTVYYGKDGELWKIE